LTQNKVLFFLTSTYPFGTGETFIENEMPYLAAAFDEVVIISNEMQAAQTREVPANVTLKRYPYELAASEKPKAVQVLFHQWFWQELKWIITSKHKKLNRGVLNTMLISLFKAHKTANYLQKLAQRYKGATIYGYSYWCNDMALALAVWKSKQATIKTIARGHGWDIYLERTQFNYLPYRKLMASRLDSISLISNQGKNYWETHFDGSSTISVSRLGIEGSAVKTKQISEGQTNLLVSCSSLIPLKRVHLLIEALALLPEGLKVHWVHFGSGPLQLDLQAKSKELLSDKKGIKWEWKGQAANSEVLHYYAEHTPDLFINVSETEGVPVSIMEAFAYGIPAMATDVGGVSELVKNEKSGFLLPVEVGASQLAQKIAAYLSLPEARKNFMGKSAYDTWRQDYNADKNYRAFTESLLGL